MISAERVIFDLLNACIGKLNYCNMDINKAKETEEKSSLSLLINQFLRIKKYLRKRNE